MINIGIKNLTIKNLSLNFRKFTNNQIRYFYDNNKNINQSEENNITKIDKVQFTNNSCLILKEMNNKYTLSISQFALMSISGISFYNFVKSVMVSNYLPMIGWSFLFYLSFQVNLNLIKNQRQVIREIRINKLQEENYEIELKVMGSFKKITYDLKKITITEIKEKSNKWPGQLFTRIRINEDEYVIPIKTVVVFNDNIYSKLITGRINNYL